MWELVAIPSTSITLHCVYSVEGYKDILDLINFRLKCEYLMSWPLCNHRSR